MPYPKNLITVAAAVIQNKGRVLIARRMKGSYFELKWEFPGGKIEPNETPERCLIRELSEEFGINTITGKHILSSIFHYPDFTINLMAYYSQYISGNFVLHSHEEIQWVLPHHLDNFDFCDADIPIVHKLLDK